LKPIKNKKGAPVENTAARGRSQNHRPQPVRPERIKSVVLHFRV